MENEEFDASIAMKLMESVKLLRKHGIINLDEKKDIDKRLEKLIESENYIITKPFRTCDAEMKTAYHFMMCLKRKCMKEQNENR